MLERTMAQGVRIHPDGVALQLQSNQPDVTGQLLIDCMGNFSPIVRQVLHPLYCVTPFVLCHTLHTVPAVVYTPHKSVEHMADVAVPLRVVCRVLQGVVKQRHY